MKKILIIEDDPGISEVLKLMLEMEGYETDLINRDGFELDKKIKTNRPNLILLDLLLSGVDGRDIARKLKTSTTTKHIPIIMLSAHPNAKESVINAGANEFIAKPFQVNDLLSKISQYTG